MSLRAPLLSGCFSCLFLLSFTTRGAADDLPENRFLPHPTADQTQLFQPPQAGPRNPPVTPNRFEALPGRTKAQQAEALRAAAKSLMTGGLMREARELIRRALELENEIREESAATPDQVKVLRELRELRAAVEDLRRDVAALRKLLETAVADEPAVPLNPFATSQGAEKPSDLPQSIPVPDLSFTELHFTVPENPAAPRQTPPPAPAVTPSQPSEKSPAEQP
ncbi:hypothetical protein [Planctomicrobium sp. SH664]|uniref:hypothetical protein n=1 Tax=Planctomicrobium sp. SH664 TaxID=3448125 RepID=UPI003F5C5730